MLAPGPIGFLELLRVARQMQRKPLDTYLALQKQYGDVVMLDLGRLKIILVAHPDHVQHVLRDQHRRYRKGVFNAPLIPLLGNGLLTSEGEFWLRQRRLAQPAFHRRRIESLVELMHESMQPLLGRWKDAAKSARPYDVAPDMNQVTLDIVGKALFGADTEQMAPIIREAFSTALDHVNFRSTHPFAPPSWLPTPRNLRYRRAKKQLDKSVYEIIAARRESLVEGVDLLGMLLSARDAETGEGMNDLQLRDEVITFLLAGHETTAHALTWTFALLGQYPEVAEKLRSELDSVLNGKSPALADISALPYARMVIEEAMRLYPPSVVIPRQANTADYIGGYEVPANAAVLVSQYVTHRHPDFWPDPERFDPERFAQGQVAERHKFAYIPFGAGPRICIGEQFALLEAQVVLASLAQRFSWELAAGEWPELETAVTLRPKGGLQLVLRERN